MARTRGSVRARRRRLAVRHSWLRSWRRSTWLPAAGSDPLIAATLLPVALVGLSTGLSMRPQVAELPPRGRDDSSLAPIARGRARALVAAAADLALGDGARDVADRDRYRLVGRGRAALDRARIRHGASPGLAMVPLGSALAAAATPVGPELYGAVSASVQARASFFSEWHHPRYSDPPWWLALMLAAVMAVCVFRYRRQVGWIRVALLLLRDRMCGVVVADRPSRRVCPGAGRRRPRSSVTLGRPAQRRSRREALLVRDRMSP